MKPLKSPCKKQGLVIKEESRMNKIDGKIKKEPSKT